MKSMFLTLLLAAAAIAAAADDAPSLSGKWEIQSSIAGNESTQTCTFTQKDADLTGSCESSRGTVQIAGKVEGKKVTWAYKTEYDGNPLTVAYDGAIESAGKVSGTVTAVEYGVSGEFTATPSKQEQAP